MLPIHLPRSGNHEIDGGEPVDPQNDFETLMVKMKVYVRRDKTQKLFIYLGIYFHQSSPMLTSDGTNFADLRQNMEKEFANRQVS